MDDIVQFSSDDEDNKNVENCFTLQMKRISREAYPKHLSKRHTGACVTLNCSPPKWRISCKSVNLIGFLSDEIVAYAEYIKPCESELIIRTHIMRTLQDLVAALIPDAQLHPFGSTATNTVLANGDIDLVILNKVQQHDPLPTLRKLNSHLRRHKDFTRVLLIDKAKVPIVKFVHALSGIYIDISCDQLNGIKAAETMNMILSKKPFHSLLYVLKAFFREHNLNEVRTGGFGSFALTIMISGFLSSHPITRDSSCDLKSNIGVILLDFLECIGKNLNPQRCGISLNGFVPQNERGFLTRDPDAPKNNVTGGSYAYYIARSAMYLAFCKLTDAIYLHTSNIRWFYDKLSQEQGINYDQVFVQDPDPHPKAPLPCTLLGYILDLGYNLDKHHRTMQRVHAGIETSGICNTSFENPPEIVQEIVAVEDDGLYHPLLKRKHSDEIIQISSNMYDEDLDDSIIINHKRRHSDDQTLTADEYPSKKPRLEKW